MTTDCEMCGNRITVMCFLGTGVCSEQCRKKREALVREMEERYA